MRKGVTMAAVVAAVVGLAPVERVREEVTTKVAAAAPAPAELAREGVTTKVVVAGQEVEADPALEELVLEEVTTTVTEDDLEAASPDPVEPDQEVETTIAAGVAQEVEITTVVVAAQEEEAAIVAADAPEEGTTTAAVAAQEEGTTTAAVAAQEEGTTTAAVAAQEEGTITVAVAARAEEDKAADKRGAIAEDDRAVVNLVPAGLDQGEEMKVVGEVARAVGSLEDRPEATTEDALAEANPAPEELDQEAGRADKPVVRPEAVTEDGPVGGTTDHPSPEGGSPVATTADDPEGVHRAHRNKVAGMEADLVVLVVAMVAVAVGSLEGEDSPVEEVREVAQGTYLGVILFSTSLTLRQPLFLFFSPPGHRMVLPGNTWAHITSRSRFRIY
jgi:hypothetical protein